MYFVANLTDARSKEQISIVTMLICTRAPGLGVFWAEVHGAHRNELLHEVHKTDRYPVIWPADPVGWLAGRDPIAAWVVDDRRPAPRPPLAASSRPMRAGADPWALRVALFVLP